MLAIVPLEHCTNFSSEPLCLVSRPNHRTMQDTQSQSLPNLYLCTLVPTGCKWIKQACKRAKHPFNTASRDFPLNKYQLAVKLSQNLLPFILVQEIVFSFISSSQGSSSTYRVFWECHGERLVEPTSETQQGSGPRLREWGVPPAAKGVLHPGPAAYCLSFCLLEVSPILIMWIPSWYNSWETSWG